MNPIKTTTMPIVALRGPVLFPGLTIHVDAGRKASVAALRKAFKDDTEIFFVTQRNITVENPTQKDLYSVGVIGVVHQLMRLPENGNIIRVVIEGERRARLDEITSEKPYLTGTVTEIADDYTVTRDVTDITDADPKIVSRALIARMFSLFGEYCRLEAENPADIPDEIFNIDNPGEMADMIAGTVPLQTNEREIILEEANIYRRALGTCVLLLNSIEVAKAANEIEDKVQQQMDKNQREYYLREEMKAISDELGESDSDDAAMLIKQIDKSKWSDECKTKLKAEAERYRRLSPSSPDAAVLRSYIEKCLEIPVGKFSKEKTNLEAASRVLEKDHYGLKEVKKRIVEMIAALIVSPDIKGQIICLAGPPGVGKTSIAKSIAKATGRNYARISLGGVHDEAEIRGHRRTYIGAMPGRIVNALIDAGTQNALILLDEVDKLGSDIKGDPASALLEVLDGEQNFAFKDHYIDLPLDLSKVLFITTANDKYSIPDALRDRMEVIDIPGYTFEEKVQIAKKHLIPKQLKEHGLKKENLSISDKALRLVIDGYTEEAGVRVLERKIAALCRAETVRLASENTEKLEITDKNLAEFLGVRKFRPEDDEREDMVGLVNGLAWTAVGGTLLPVEVAVLPGTGKLELTGSLGDVIKESARTAVSFVRSKADEYGIDPKFYTDKDIHIHFPDGATPKDGPSAGITITTALVSALTGKKVRSDVAMTGEITLRGRVTAIGGLREKSMAAYRKKIKRVYIPYSNEPDLEEVDDTVKAHVEFVPVKYAEEVISKVLY